MCRPSFRGNTFLKITHRFYLLCNLNKMLNNLLCNLNKMLADRNKMLTLGDCETASSVVSVVSVFFRKFESNEMKIFTSCLDVTLTSLKRVCRPSFRGNTFLKITHRFYLSCDLNKMLDDLSCNLNKILVDLNKMLTLRDSEFCRFCRFCRFCLFWKISIE